MVIERIKEIAALSPEEKLILAAELWRENAIGEAEEADPQMAAMLQERLARHEADPHERPWEAIRDELLAR